MECSVTSSFWLFSLSRLSMRFSKACMPIIFPYLVYTILCYCSLFLQVKSVIMSAQILRLIHCKEFYCFEIPFQSLASFNMMNACHILGPTTVTVFWLYVFCHFGNHLTQRFSDLGDSVYQLDWYMLPSDLQKDLSIFLPLAQKDIFLEGYAGVRCTCQVFMKVTNGKIFDNLFNT